MMKSRVIDAGGGNSCDDDAASTVQLLRPRSVALALVAYFTQPERVRQFVLAPKWFEPE